MRLGLAAACCAMGWLDVWLMESVRDFPTAAAAIGLAGLFCLGAAMWHVTRWASAEL